MAITIRSAKSKGMRFQKIIADWILKLRPDLEPDDVKSTPAGMNGADIQLSPAAKRVFNYAVECKAKAKAAHYTDYDQACRHAEKTGGEPILMTKIDRRDPLVTMSLKHFEALLKGQS